MWPVVTGSASTEKTRWSDRGIATWIACGYRAGGPMLLKHRCTLVMHLLDSGK